MILEFTLLQRECGQPLTLKGQEGDVQPCV